MDTKKLLILGLILIAAIGAISTISAEDVVTSTSSSMTLVNSDLTINDIHFKVPDGFEEVDKDAASDDDDDDEEEDNDDDEGEDIDGTAVDAKTTAEFKNDAKEKLEVTVGILGNNKKIESINPSGFEKKSIAEKDGFFKKESDDGKDQFVFEYLEDGKLVKIVAPSEDMISQVIA